MPVVYFEDRLHCVHVQESSYGAFHSDNRMESMNKKYKEGLSLLKVPVSTLPPCSARPADARDQAGGGNAQWRSSSLRSSSQPISGEIRCTHRGKGTVLRKMRCLRS